MYVNDIGAQRATRSTCRGEQSAQRRASFTSYATRLVAIGWSFCARCRAHEGRDVRVPSANAVSADPQCWSVFVVRACVRYARVCACIRWVREKPRGTVETRGRPGRRSQHLDSRDDASRNGVRYAAIC